MTIKVGDRLPAVNLLQMGAGGPEQVNLADLARGKRIALFGYPGAYTGTCSAEHIPSFIRTKAGFAAKGIDTVVGVSGNDPFVLKAYGDTTGATAAGLQLMGDPFGTFVEAIDMVLTAPPVGFNKRSKRFALIADDGVVTVLHAEESPGQCTVSSGESLLAEA